MGEAKMQARRRAKRVEHQLRKQTDGVIGALRRARARARTLRQSVILVAVGGLGLVGAIIQALGLWRRTASRLTSEPRKRPVPAPAASAAAPGVSEHRADGGMGHADERTIRRMAERELGGMSTEEMLARYEGGLQPGGLHGRAMRERIASDEIRHVHDEPEDPKLRRPGHDRHMSAHRRGHY